MIEQHGDIKIYRVMYPQNEELYSVIKDKIHEVTNQPSYMPFTNTIIDSNSVSVATNKAGRCSFWNADGEGMKLYKWEELSDYFAFVKPHIRTYLEAIGIDEKDIVTRNCWANEYPKGTNTNRHRHLYSDYGTGHHNHKTPYDIIGVLLYINKPEGTADLMLEIDGKMTDMNVKNGEIIIFPSYQYHQTHPNMSDEYKHLVGIELLTRWISNDVIEGLTLEEL